MTGLGDAVSWMLRAHMARTTPLAVTLDHVTPRVVGPLYTHSTIEARGCLLYLRHRSGLH